MKSILIDGVKQPAPEVYEQLMNPPPRWTWFSVETPSVFKEHKLPASEADWTKAHRAHFRELETLADSYDTHIHRSEYRRG